MTEYLLGELLVIKNGKDHKALNDGNIPVYGSGGLMRYVNKSIYDGESILLPRKGSLENIQYVNKPFWTVDTLYYSIVNNETANAFYLFNYLRRLDLSNLNSGTGVPSMTFGAYYNVKVQLPDLPTQQKIASVLSALDDKIELNNKINTELAAMAKTLYDYWFVQFDFPNPSTSSGQVGKPYKSSGGEMVYDEVLKREIPKGWEPGKLADLGEVIGGSTPPREIDDYFSKTGTAWITPKDLSQNKGNKFIAHGELDVSEKGIKNASLRIMPKGTILLSTRAPVGYLAISQDFVTTNQGFKSFVPSKGYSSEFIYYAVKNLIPTIENNAVGSTFKEISASTLKGIALCLPDKDVIDDYVKIVMPIFKRQELLEQQNKELAILRDWLLPMLMNGQVTVNDAYAIVEEELGMVAEVGAEYKKAQKLNIPQNRKPFAKQVLAGKIVSLFKEDPHFSHIKFQKIQFLAEHIAQADLNLNYYFQSAGPYDNKFMHTIFSNLKKQKWFEEKDFKFIALDKCLKIDNYYDGYFSPVINQLQRLYELLQNASEATCEIIATLYAVWNNRIIKKQEILDDLIIEDFYNWSDRKLKYNIEEVARGLDIIKTSGFEPVGFGKEMKLAKNKN